MRWWLFTAPTTGPPASRRNDRRPSSTTRRPGRASPSASASSRSWRNCAHPAGDARWPRARRRRGLPREAPDRRQLDRRSPTVRTNRRTRRPTTSAGWPGAARTAPAATAKAAPGARLGIVAGRDGEPRLHLLGAVDEDQRAAVGGPRDERSASGRPPRRC